MQANRNSLPEKNGGKVCNQQYCLGHLRHEICPVAHHELLTWAACATSRGPNRIDGDLHKQEGYTRTIKTLPTYMIHHDTIPCINIQYNTIYIYIYIRLSLHTYQHLPTRLSLLSLFGTFFFSFSTSDLSLANAGLVHTLENTLCIWISSSLISQYIRLYPYTSTICFLCSLAASRLDMWCRS